MRKQHWIIVYAIFFGLVVWVFDSLMDSLFFYEDSFLNLLLLNMPKAEIFFRVQVLIFFTIFGIIISSLFFRKQKAETELQKMYTELEKKVEERTANLSEANQRLNKVMEERIHAEHLVKRHQHMLQGVFDGISEPLVLMGPGRHMKIMNKAAIDYYGLQEGSLSLDGACHRVLKDSESPCPECKVPFDMAGNHITQFERKGFVDPERVEIVYLYPVKNDENDTWDQLIRISDVTEQRIFERQALENEKMASLGVLISSVAHEINNPINFISFNVPILRDYVDELMPVIDEYAQRHPDFEVSHMTYDDFRKDILTLIDNLEHGAERIKSVVSNLKEFNRVKYVVRKKWIDPQEVIENVLQANRLKSLKQVKIFKEAIPENLPWIWSDPYALEQILLNLLTNAAHASEREDSRVTLRVKIGGSWSNHFIVEISDNGTGMDEKTLEKIFDPFFTTKSPPKGTGLGLYVCHQLVLSLGGRIEVESEPGKGSTFRVILIGKERRKQKRAPTEDGHVNDRTEVTLKNL